MISKPKVNRVELLNPDDIWNAVVFALAEYDYSAESQVVREAYTAFQYFSEMESGGHESFFRWNSDHIEVVGITPYLKELLNGLENTGAHEYAKIVNNYGEEIWRLYVALENEEISEEKFYEVVEKADNEYYSLDGKLSELLEKYFISIHTELLDVVEE